MTNPKDNGGDSPSTGEVIHQTETEPAFIVPGLSLRWKGAEVARQSAGLSSILMWGIDGQRGMNTKAIDSIVPKLLREAARIVEEHNAIANKNPTE